MTQDEEVLQKKLLKYKLLSEEQLTEGLKAQRVMAELGIQKELRDVLIEKGFISLGQLKEKGLQKSIKYIIEGYTLQKKLGKGSMGAVYKARNNETGEIFAIKILSGQLGRDMNFIKRFLLEAKHCIDLEHDNIVKAYEVGFSNDRYYFTMEYIQGEDLRKKINRLGTFQEAEIFTILTQISRALDYADSIGLIHRDVKPDNIIIDSDGVAKLCDLGLAKIGLSDQHSLTQAGMVVGTPFYISPEQCRGWDLDIRSDVYSLGATLYHMVTGQVPFNAPDGIAILAKHISEAPIPPKELRPDLSEECNATLLKMLAKKPEDRFDPKSLLKEIGNIRERRHLASSLDIKFDTPLGEIPVTEDTHFDLYEQVTDLSEDSEKSVPREHEDLIREKEPAVPFDENEEDKDPSPKSSVLFKRKISSNSSPFQWSRRTLILVIFSLVGLSGVLLLILFQILTEFNQFSEQNPKEAQLSPEAQVIEKFFPDLAVYNKDKLRIQTSFKDPSKDRFLWYYNGDSDYQFKPEKLVIQNEANCQIKFAPQEFSLKMEFEIQKSSFQKTNQHPSRIRFIGYQLLLPIDELSPISLCHHNLKVPLKTSKMILKEGKRYTLLIEKSGSQIWISLNHQEILSYKELFPLETSSGYNTTKLIFKTNKSSHIILHQMEIEGNFHPDYLAKKYQDYLKSR